MFIDARQIPAGTAIEADVCVVGAGAAGITIAVELLGAGARVALLEGGGLDLDFDSQELYDGDNIGLPYYSLDSCRLRYFGGTTNHWGGYCQPFRDFGFDGQAWIPNTGWPIGQDDIQGFFARAVQLLDLEPQAWRLENWQERLGEAPVPFDPRRFRHRIFQIRPVRMAQIYGDQLRRDQNTTVYLNANAVEIETNDDATTVTGVRVRTFAGTELTFKARWFVLAAGGIENPRLLLISNRVQRDGLGNQNGLVGRYFIEHPICQAATWMVADPGLDLDLYRRHQLEDEDLLVQLVVAPDRWPEQEIVPTSLTLFPVVDERFDSEAARSLRYLMRSVIQFDLPDDLGTHLGRILSDLTEVVDLGVQTLRYGQVPLREVSCNLAMSPTPNPDSRVVLLDEVDRLGMPRVALDWRLTAQDKQSALYTVEAFGREVGRLGLGRVRSHLVDDDQTWPDDLVGAFHHIGTTRMSEEPNTGVVDRHCRVHRIDNLFVAGSSVFSDAGDGTPTLMIITLAARLAAQLKQHLA